jgi:hypothetical protein
VRTSKIAGNSGKTSIGYSSMYFSKDGKTSYFYTG